MTTQAPDESIYGGIAVVGTVSIVAPGASVLVAFSSCSQKTGVSGACGVRPRLVFKKNIR